MNHTQQYDACLQACFDCIAACNGCLSACLAEPDVKMMARCIALDIDCAEACQLAAAAMARASESSKAICAMCATVCEACGAECAQHDMEHCQACATACKRCAEECRRMAAMA